MEQNTVKKEPLGKNFYVNVSHNHTFGNDAILSIEGVDNQSVHVGIRPEGFIPDENGSLVCKMINVEIMGRDMSVISAHGACDSQIRAIVDSDAVIPENSDTIRYSVKPSKLLIFNKETEERIYYTVK